MSKKKLIAIIAAVLAVVIVVSVIFVVKNQNKKEETTTEVTTVEEAETKAEEITVPEETEAPTNRKTIDEFVKNDLGIPNAIVSEGHKVQNGVVYFVDEPYEDSEDFFTNRYMIADTGERFIIEELFNGVGKLKIYYVDVDGEKGEEIVVHMNTGGNGGYGIHISYVFRLDENKFFSLFDSETDTWMRNAFKSELKADYKAVITCREAAFEKVIDLSKRKSMYDNNVFDSQGNPINNHKIWFDSSFYRFEPVDTDNDGIYEIVCRQYSSLYSHIDFTGIAQLTLKCSGSMFEIIDADFSEEKDEEFAKGLI